MKFEEARIEPGPRRMPAWLAIGAAIALALLILLIVASMLVPMVLQEFAFASAGKAKADLMQIDSALREYSLANGGRYPENLEALVTPDVNGHTYIKGTRVPRDPWGNEYLYTAPEAEGDFPVVYTRGKDGRRGGQGDDADMDNFSIREDR